MTELEVLQHIQQGIEALVMINGIFIGLFATIIFALAWGRNTHV